MSRDRAELIRAAERYTDEAELKRQEGDVRGAAFAAGYANGIRLALRALCGGTGYATRDPSPSRKKAHHHRTKGAPSFATQAKISRKIRMLVREEGYSPKQAAAIAYRYYGVARPKKKAARDLSPAIDKARLLADVRRAGYEARPTRSSYRMKIVRRSDGKVVGTMTATEAHAWLRAKRRR